MARLFKICGLVFITGAVVFYLFNKDNGGDIPSALGFGLLISFVIFLMGSLQRFEIKAGKLFFLDLFVYRRHWPYLPWEGIKIEDIFRVELKQSPQRVRMYTAMGFIAKGIPGSTPQPDSNLSSAKKCFNDYLPILKTQIRASNLTKKLELC